MEQQLTLESIEIEQALWKLHDKFKRTVAPRCYAQLLNQPGVPTLSEPVVATAPLAPPNYEASNSNVPVSSFNVETKPILPKKPVEIIEKNSRSRPDMISFMERIFCEIAKVSSVIAYA